MASSQAIDRYQHGRLASPTSQIRLLKFNVSDDTHLLSGSLEIHDLSEYRPYVALSYEWGEPENQVEIIIDGKIFWIRHNLGLFLSVLKRQQQRRDFVNDLVLFIDAICINQGDLEERNAQVSMMGTIYQQAVSVFAWLGWPQGWDPLQTFKSIKIWSGRAADAPVNACSITTEYFGGLWLGPEDLLQMVLWMCQCRYWSRRWILQEILLARNVIIKCGENELPWKTLVQFLQQAKQLGLRPGSEIASKLQKTVPYVMSLYNDGQVYKPAKSHNILELLRDFSQTDCEVLHDKVYSLLSLAYDGDCILVDYGCSPQNLLCHVMTSGSWLSLEELEKIAEQLGVPEFVPFRLRYTQQSSPSESSAQSQIEKQLNTTHKVFHCTDLPTALREPQTQPRATENEMLSGLQGSGTRFPERFDGFSHRSKQARPSQWDNGVFDVRVASNSRLGPKDMLPVDSKLIFCDDGNAGAACKTAQVGDLLCDFLPNRKLVVREDFDQNLRLIGTAILWEDPTPNFNDLLSMADNLRGTGRNAQQSLMQVLIASSLRLCWKTMISHDVRGHLQPQMLKSSFDMWDLIDLARGDEPLKSVPGTSAPERPDRDTPAELVLDVI